MTHGRAMAPPLLSMAMMLAIAPLAARAGQGARGREPAPQAASVLQPQTANPVAEPTREPGNDFPDPLRDVDGRSAEQA
jgi:hypothetical protein